MDKRKVDTKPLLDGVQEREQLLAGMISERVSFAKIAAKLGLSEAVIKSTVSDVAFAIGANDDLLDDYLALLTGCEQALAPKEASPPADDASVETCSETANFQKRASRILAEIEQECSTGGMRDVAQSLLRLADALDQNWRPENVRASCRWPSTAARIEKNSLELAKKAQRLMRDEQLNGEVLSEDILNRPAWNMLLDLFIQFSGGAKVSVKSLTVASRCPATTALRYIAHLENEGLIKRTPSDVDGRVILCSLTKTGVVAVGRILERASV